jgi:hypothetical protein
MSRLLFIICILFSISLFADSEEIEIEWEGVKKISEYQFQVREVGEEKIVLEEKVKDTKIKFTLPSGKYEYRIGSLLFPTKPIWNEWSPFIVRRIRIPSIATPQELKLKIFEVEKEIKIIGDGFEEDMKVRLQSGDATIPTEYKIIDKNTFTLKIKLTDNKHNSFDLVLENPNNRILYQKNFISFTEPIDSKRWQVFRRSAVLPGWGQDYRGDVNRRKYIYFPAILLFTGLYIKSRIENQTANNEYKSLLNNSILLGSANSSSGTNPLALFFMNQSIAARADLNSSYSQGTIMISLMAGVYLLNLVDALFFYDYSSKANLNTSGFFIHSNKNYYSQSLTTEILYAAGYTFEF